MEKENPVTSSLSCVKPRCVVIDELTSVLVPEIERAATTDSRYFTGLYSQILMIVLANTKQTRDHLAFLAGLRSANPDLECRHTSRSAIRDHMAVLSGAACRRHLCTAREPGHHASSDATSALAGHARQAFIGMITKRSICPSCKPHNAGNHLESAPLDSRRLARAQAHTPTATPPSASTHNARNALEVCAMSGDRSPWIVFAPRRPGARASRTDRASNKQANALRAVISQTHSRLSRQAMAKGPTDQLARDHVGSCVAGWSRAGMIAAVERASAAAWPCEVVGHDASERGHAGVA